LNPASGVVRIRADPAKVFVHVPVAYMYSTGPHRSQTTAPVAFSNML